MRLSDSSGAIDLNADVGEQPADLALVSLVTSASVACGGHAGDRSAMAAVIDEALEHQTVIGAHPSYADRAGFGRVELGLEPDVVAAQVLDQISELSSVASEAGATVSYVKFHGALYHRANADRRCAEVLVAALSGADWCPRVLLAAPASAMADEARQAGWLSAREGFCDRAYTAAGLLVERGRPGAVLADPEIAAAQAVSLASDGTVRAADGSVVTVHPDSLCLHGDSPDAFRIAHSVRRALSEAGISLRPFVSTHD